MKMNIKDIIILVIVKVVAAVGSLLLFLVPLFSMYYIKDGKIRINLRKMMLHHPMVLGIMKILMRIIVIIIIIITTIIIIVIIIIHLVVELVILFLDLWLEIICITEIVIDTDLDLDLDLDQDPERDIDVEPPLHLILIPQLVLVIRKDVKKFFVKINFFFSSSFFFL